MASSNSEPPDEENCRESVNVKNSGFEVSGLSLAELSELIDSLPAEMGVFDSFEALVRFAQDWRRNT